MTVERGSLVLADITGSAGYLTGAELEHSQDVIADLLQVIVDTGMASWCSASWRATACSRTGRATMRAPSSL